MELDIVDQLLICLIDQPRNVPLAMRERGYTQEQISKAWTKARRLRFTEFDRARSRSTHKRGQI